MPHKNYKNYESLFQFKKVMLSDLCPPFEAFGVGGSTLQGNTDIMSDIDFFIFAPERTFLGLVRDFPRLISHPEPPLCERRKGFAPDFGYSYSFVYPGYRVVDYNLNCLRTIQETPMLAKTTIIKDTTGKYVALHEKARMAVRRSPSTVHAEASAEILIEMLKVRKYVSRREFVAVNHRLERLRLVLIALFRYNSNEPYCPHDSDKWVDRDLPVAFKVDLAQTFANATADAIYLALSKTIELILRELKLLSTEEAKMKIILCIRELLSESLRMITT